MEAVKLKRVGLEPVGLTGVGLESFFFNYYAKLALTLGVNESAGLNTSANSTGAPYGSDALGGLGDCSTDFMTTKGTGWSYDATGDRYDCDGSQVAESLLTKTGVLTVGELDKIRFVVTRSAGTVKIVMGTTDGTSRNASGTYWESLTVAGNTSFFISADADFVGTVDTMIIKPIIGPSSCLLSEIDRTLRANGVEISTSTFSDVNYNTFDGESSSGFHAITDGLAVCRAFTDDDIPIVNGNRYSISWTTSLASGTAPRFLVRPTVGGGTLYVVVPNADTTNYVEFTASATDTVVAYFDNEQGGTSAQEYTISNFSFQEMQPTASLIERVDNAETFLIDNAAITYSAGAPLEIVKDGSVATMFYNSLIVDAGQTIDSSLTTNVIHSAYGATGEVIQPLLFGVLIVTGTLVSGIIYKVITTEVDNFGTGVVVGDYFNSNGTETCDANNTVKQVAGQ